MRFRPTIVLFEGADGAGKTTSINTFKKMASESGVRCRELEFGKRNFSNEKFKIASANELQTYLTLVSHLDPSVIYVQDRGIISNIVYDGDSVLQRTALSILKTDVNLKTIIFDRDLVFEDFEDDLIKLDKTAFNEIILKYRHIAEVDGVKRIKLHPHFDSLAYKELIDTFSTIIS